MGKKRSRGEVCLYNAVRVIMLRVGEKRCTDMPGEWTFYVPLAEDEEKTTEFQKLVGCVVNEMNEVYAYSSINELGEEPYKLCKMLIRFLRDDESGDSDFVGTDLSSMDISFPVDEFMDVAKRATIVCTSEDMENIDEEDDEEVSEGADSDEDADDV